VQRLTEELFGAWKPELSNLREARVEEWLGGDHAPEDAAGTSGQKTVYLVDKPRLTQG
jgi:hypothetical protein